MTVWIRQWNLMCAGIAVLSLFAFADFASAQIASPDNGEIIYLERCAGCHGQEGDGLGPGAERLNPPPRDFTMAQYKLVTTGFDDFVPNNEDLVRMISDGMPGTSMPGWRDVLSAGEINDLVVYLLLLGGLEEEVPTDQLDYGEQIPTSSESLARGREIFLFEERCSECHGTEGRGDGIKKLRDDNGDRTWPRNLTRPSTFRASNDPRDIFARVTVGIPGTEMPSFDDPRSAKRLNIEDRWHVANYVNSLAETVAVVSADNTVVVASRVEGDLPTSHQDELWQDATSTSYFLVPQIITGERLFTPTNNVISVRALYNNTDIAFLLEWDDRTKSLPGDADAEKLSESGLAEDRIRIQLPVEIPEGMERPYFYMGNRGHTVNLLEWTSGTAEEPAGTLMANSEGPAAVLSRPASEAALTAAGAYENGTWHVVMTRRLTTSFADLDLQFEEGRYIPIAFAAWDGSNSENGSRHTLTSWNWLLLQPAGDNRPIFAAIIALVLAGALLFFWQSTATKRRRSGV